MVPDSPKRSSTIDEMMIVSIVMPETGLRAVVAIALAATEVKKNENTSASATPAIRIAGERGRRRAEEDRRLPSALDDHADQNA